MIDMCIKRQYAGIVRDPSSHNSGGNLISFVQDGVLCVDARAGRNVERLCASVSTAERFFMLRRVGPSTSKDMGNIVHGIA